MNPAVRRWVLWGLFLVSGAPGLMAQVAWTRIFSAGLGHEFPALMGVVSAYFAGLAAGAAWAGRWSGSWRRPALVYGCLELACALWILVTTPGLDSLFEGARTWLGVGRSTWVEAGLAFVLPLGVIGPAAAALGATLPAMERAVAPLERDGRAVAGLYALNTAGAVGGVLLAVGYAMPVLGFRGTLLLAAAMQFVCGLVAIGMGWREVAGTRTTTKSRLEVHAATEVEATKRRVLGMAWVTGLLGIAYELMGVRALAQVTENTIHTYAVALVSVLVGMAVGAAWHRNRAQRAREWTSPTLLGVLGMVCGVELWVLGSGGWMVERGREWVGGLGAEVLLGMSVFLGPSILMGMIFSQWVQRAARWEGGVGRAVAWNCLGGAMASPLVLGVMLPWSGLKWTLAGVAVGYLLLMLPRGWSGWRAVMPVVGVGAALAAPGDLRLLEVPAGASVVRAWEGRLASVAVIRTADGERVLRVNNHFQQGGTATAVAARRHAQLPLLMHPNPRSVLFLGVGTGITMGAAVDPPGMRVDGVELLPEVVAALDLFGLENRSPHRREGFRVMVADARRYVRTANHRYDVIMADLFHPSEDGAGMLYTREHFQAVRARLEPGGVFCQWLPLHQLDLGGFRDVGRTFLDVFPEASLWLLRFNLDVPVVGLVGGLEPWKVNPEALEDRMAGPELQAALKPLALTDPVRLLGCRLADAHSLRGLVEGGRVATDDLPRVMYGAARTVYRQAETPAARLLAVLANAEPGFAACVGGDRASVWVTRLESFRAARDRHLNGLAKETGGRREAALEDYVASAGLSRDYTAGYAQAVLVASAFAKENPELARSVLSRLVVAQPEQRLARELLERLGP